MREDADDARRGPTTEEMERAAPPERGGREVQVGVFVLLGITAFLLALFLLTDPATFRGRYMLGTVVEDAGGLRRGDPVQMRGVNIGRVHGFRLTGEGVMITLEVEGEWDVPRGSRVRLTSTGLLGGRIVQIVPEPGNPPLPAGATIPGTDAPGLMESAQDLGPQVRTTLETAEGALARVESLLDEPTVSTLQGSAVELRTVLRDLATLIRVQGEEIRSLTASLGRTAESLEGAGPDVRSAASRADSTLLQMNRTAATLDETAESLDSVLRRLEAGEGTLGRLLVDESLYRNLDGAAEQVRLLAQDVRENPRRYLDLEIF